MAKEAKEAKVEPKSAATTKPSVEKITAEPTVVGGDTILYGTETPYRKTPPSNYGSNIEATATTTPPVPAVDPTTITTAQTPVNTVAPVVSGTTTVGQTLTCSTGTWFPVPGSFTFQWFHSPDTPIAGATANTRVLAAGDLGQRIFCVVTGKIATYGGYAPKPSNTVGPIVAA